MAQILVGELVSLEISSEEYGSRVFEIKAGSDHSLELGGEQAVDDSGMITTSGKVVKKMETLRSEFKVTVVTDNRNNDIQFLKLVSSSVLESTTTWVHVSGAIYTSNSFPVGAIELKGNDGEVEVTFQGSKIEQLSA